MEVILAGDGRAIESSRDELNGVQRVDPDDTSRRRVEWKNMIRSVYLTSTAGSETKDPDLSRYTTLATYFGSGNRPIAADRGGLQNGSIAEQLDCRTARLQNGSIAHACDHEQEHACCNW